MDEKLLLVFLMLSEHFYTKMNLLQNRKWFCILPLNLCTWRLFKHGDLETFDLEKRKTTFLRNYLEKFQKAPLSSSDLHKTPMNENFSHLPPWSFVFSHFRPLNPKLAFLSPKMTSFFGIKKTPLWAILSIEGSKVRENERSWG